MTSYLDHLCKKCADIRQFHAFNCAAPSKKSLCSFLIKNMASPLQKPGLNVLSPQPLQYLELCFLEALCRASVALNHGYPPAGCFTGVAATGTVDVQLLQSSSLADLRQRLGCYDWKTDWPSSQSVMDRVDQHRDLVCYCRSVDETVQTETWKSLQKHWRYVAALRSQMITFRDAGAAVPTYKHCVFETWHTKIEQAWCVVL